MPKITTQSDSVRLEQAFEQFNELSSRLIGAYQQLEEQVAVLGGKLAAANEALRAEAARNEALAARLSLLLEALPAGVLELDRAGCVVSANPAAQALLPTLVPGKRWPQEVLPFVPGDDAPLLRLPADDGQTRFLQVQTCPLREDGAVLVLLHDVTPLNRLHEQLAQQQRLASMGQMAASLAHQLRTPLSTALLYAANLQRDDLPSAERARFAGKVVDRVRALESLVQNMLGFVRSEDEGGVVAAQPLFEELVAMIQPQCERARIALSTHMALSAGVSVRGERKALLSAWVALAENALSFAPRGGQVKLQVAEEGGNLEFSVEDDGPGVEPALQARIFEPFFSGRVGGTGLGLAIAKKQAERAGGGIRVGRSTKLGGAAFVMALPLLAAT